MFLILEHSIVTAEKKSENDEYIYIELDIKCRYIQIYFLMFYSYILSFLLLQLSTL